MPDTFTPEQISQILEEFFKVVGTRQYIGARYVPIFGRKDEDSIEWDNTAPYEPLTIVLYQGNSYTSRQFVPVGVEITNQEFWAITGNYNAQVEQYRRETAAAREVADNALAAANDAQDDIDTLLPKSDFSAENTVKKYVDASVAPVQADIDTLLPKADFSAENTVKKYVDDSVAPVQADIDTLLPKADFSAENTVKKYVDDSVAPVQADIDTLLPKADFSAENTVKKYVDDSARGIVGITRRYDTGRYFLVESKDGNNFNILHEFEDTSTFNDSSALFEYGDYFYYTTNNAWSKSTDLINWEPLENFGVTSPVEDGRVWASSLFEYNGSLYMTCTVQYSSQTVENAIGSNTYYFRIETYPVEVSADGDLSVDISQRLIVLGSNETSYIDSFIVQTQMHGLVMAVKNEITCKIEIYRGATLSTLVMQSADCHLIGLEAPQLVVDEYQNIILYAHAYSPRTISVLEDPVSARFAINNFPQMLLKCNLFHSSNNGEPVITNTLLWHRCNTVYIYRHPGFMLATEKSNAITKSMNVMNIQVPVIQKAATQRNFPTATDAPEGGVVVLTNIDYDGLVYALSGTPASNVTVKFINMFDSTAPLYVIGNTSQSGINNAHLIIGTGFSTYSSAQTRYINFANLLDGGILPIIMPKIGGLAVVPFKTT